jgi:hypothetical protein
VQYDVVFLAPRREEKKRLGLKSALETGPVLWMTEAKFEERGETTTSISGDQAVDVNEPSLESVALGASKQSSGRE